MTVKTFVLFVVCIALFGCERRSDETTKPVASTPTAAPDTFKEDENTVEIDQGMLRDLRITTRPVESRTGGELVTLLGELAVDERAYAEVGTPVAARVTRLFVNAGDRVRSGAALAELTSPELGGHRAAYLSASARLTLAGAALERKRGLAAEKIVPLREVQEAESAAGEARAALRASRAALARLRCRAARG
jgi:multidrug efflux pump subunit AcrA (membrane-fusion protein)